MAGTLADAVADGGDGRSDVKRGRGKGKSSPRRAEGRGGRGGEGGGVLVLWSGSNRSPELEQAADGVGR